MTCPLLRWRPCYLTIHLLHFFSFSFPCLFFTLLFSCVRQFLSAACCLCGVISRGQMGCVINFVTLTSGVELLFDWQGLLQPRELQNLKESQISRKEKGIFENLKNDVNDGLSTDSLNLILIFLQMSLQFDNLDENGYFLFKYQSHHMFNLIINFKIGLNGFIHWN